MKCLIMPLGNFGDHDLGYSGCVWCEQKRACLEHNPNVGKSLMARKPRKLKRIKLR